MDHGQTVAVSEYLLATGRVYEPSEEVVDIPVDALVFSEYQGQYIYPTIEDFKERRCKYDEETNDWLVHYVTNELMGPDIPPIYVDVRERGVALVDGAHRVSGHLITGRRFIRAHLNKVS